MIRRNQDKEGKLLKPTIVGQECVYCGAQATVYEHIIPKRLGAFFNAGWNLAPSCAPCNSKKSDTVSVEHIRTPGDSPIEDAAIWAAVYVSLDAATDIKQRIIERLRQDCGRWDFLARTEAFGAFEIYTKKHFCLLWDECQEQCVSNGQLIGLMQSLQVQVSVPKGLERLISGSAFA